MTPTATKAPTSVTDELAKLVNAREEKYAELQKAKRERDAFHAETTALKEEYSQHAHTYPEQWTPAANSKPLPDTDAAALAEVIRERTGGAVFDPPYPEQAKLDKLTAAFQEADAAEHDFKRAHVHERVAERWPTSDHAIDRIRKGFELVREGCELYGGEVDAVRRIVVQDTPGLEHQLGMYRHDPRPAGWALLAAGVLESEIIRPRLTEQAEWKVDR